MTHQLPLTPNITQIEDKVRAWADGLEKELGTQRSSEYAAATLGHTRTAAGLFRCQNCQENWVRLDVIKRAGQTKYMAACMPCYIASGYTNYFWQADSEEEFWEKFDGRTVKS